MFATFNGFVINWERAGKTEYGAPLYRYGVLTPKPYTLFQGEEFKPSIAAIKKPLLIPIEILQWVTLQYGEVDDALFEHYTLEQLLFANCEKIAEYNYDVDSAWMGIDNNEFIYLASTENYQIVDIYQLDSPLMIVNDGNAGPLRHC